MTDALLWARLQFATTTSLHFLFVVLSLGLVLFVAVLQTAHTIRPRPHLARMTRFWGNLYVINYGVGILTGLVMEFQFGLNWTGLATIVGNAFGAPIALETLIAFFLESTFLGMWIFGWGRIPRWVHLALIWLVAITAYVSAYWILVANAFMQNPVGVEMRDGTARLTDFTAILTNPSLVDAILHITAAALLTGALFVAGISAFHLIRGTGEQAGFRTSLRLGVVAAPIGAYAVIHYGFLQEVVIERTQPAKLAAIYGDPVLAAAVARDAAQRFGPGDLAPASWIAIPYQVMMYSAFVLVLVTIALLLLLVRNLVIRLRVPLYLLVALIPVPFVLVLCGWLVREVGRQPWVVYGILRTDQAVSAVDPAAMFGSFVGFSAVLLALVVVDYVLIARYAARGPDGAALGGVLRPPPQDTERTADEEPSWS